MILYILFILMVILLVMQIFIFPKVRKNHGQYLASFQEAVQPVEMEIAKRMKKSGFKVDDFCRLINDKGQGIVFAYDSVHDVFAVGMKDSMVFEKGEKLEDVTRTYGEKVGKKLQSAEVSFSLGEDCYRYVIASGPFNPNGYFGKNIVEITDKLYDGLMRVQNKER